MPTPTTESATDTPTPPPGKETPKIHGKNWGLLPHRRELTDEFRDEDLSPLTTGNPGFNFKEVFERLDGTEGENAMADDEELKRLAMKLSARAISALLAWLFEVNMSDPRAMKIIGVRAVAMAWVIDPERFQGASVTTLGKSLGYRGGDVLSRSAAEFSRRFGITNKFQDHCPDKEKIYEASPARN
jgi:hypothetical protein